MGMKVIEIKVVPYNALQCEAETFTINGAPADKSDFGSNENVASFDYEYGEWADENWACADNRFIPRKEIPEGVLEQYGITEEQYREIQEKLVDQFNVGSCGWCV